MTAYLNGMYTWESETHTHRVLASSLVRFHTWYAAVERIEKGSNSREVIAIVVLVRKSPRYPEFTYKDMDEGCGPVERECPEKILKLLTPTTSKYALSWRADCWNRIKNKKLRKPIKTGYHLILDKPLSFSDGSRKSVFYIENAKRRTFKEEKTGDRYTISQRALKTRNYDVVKFEGVKREDLPTLIGISQAVDQEIQRRLSKETIA